MRRVPSALTNRATRILDLQIAKNTRFPHDEKYNFQARVEMFNAFNHASLGGPGTSVGSGNFGVIQNFSRGPAEFNSLASSSSKTTTAVWV